MNAVNLVVAVTDDDWFETLRTIPSLSEVNFLAPSGAGFKALIPISRRKRCQKLLEEKRKHFRRLDREGKLRCQVCGFVAPEGLETEIIHLHHTEPIYDSGQQGRSMELKEALALLVPLCPTCHALAHTSCPPLSVAAIQALRP